MKVFFLIVSLYITTTTCKRGFGPTEQEWGFVKVRKGAHIFWWFHKTTADVKTYTERPLIIWLQGGPGVSSTGYGYFAEIGPIDLYCKKRNTSWVQYANILFVDSPVGTGFSYADSSETMASTNTQIAEDFVELLREVFKVLPDLPCMPAYIFSESYGGKMTAEIALFIDQAVKKDVLKMNLVAIGLGDPWISPIDIMESWPGYLLNLGLVDKCGYNQIKNLVKDTKVAFYENQFSKATSLYASTSAKIKSITANADLYNALVKVTRRQARFEEHSATYDEDMKIEALMNTKVKKSLQLDRYWGAQTIDVFTHLQDDFMKNVTDIVEAVLDTTDIKVVVFNGQFDIIVSTPGTIEWVNKLNFKSRSSWRKAPRKPLIVNDIVEGFVKETKNFAFYWVNRAGHMVAVDNPEAMLYILEQTTNNFTSKLNTTDFPPKTK